MALLAAACGSGGLLAPPLDSGVSDGAASPDGSGGSSGGADDSGSSGGSSSGGGSGSNSGSNSGSGSSSGSCTVASPDDWNEWPIPNSQADVTAGAPNLESYEDNGDGTVTDLVTCLMWQQTVPTTVYAQADALSYCADLTLAGHSDWRLPAEAELFSIVDFGQQSPSINETFFPGAPADWFWSSTLVAGSPYAWNINFGYGYANYKVASYPPAVRCVR